MRSDMTAHVLLLCCWTALLHIKVGKKMMNAQERMWPYGVVDLIGATTKGIHIANHGSGDSYFFIGWYLWAAVA